MESEDFRKLSLEEQAQVLRSAQGRADADDGLEPDSRAQVKRAPWNGGLIMTLGLVVMFIGFIMSSGVPSGYSGETFNLSKGLEKLMVFLSGCALLVTGAVLSLTERLEDALARAGR